MWRNILKITIRNLFRQKGYSFINITGLAIGMALFILIALYIQFEFSFDKFHKNRNRIFRVEEDFDGKGRLMSFTHAPLGPTLMKDYPEVLQYVRIFNMGTSQLLSYQEENKFYENGGWWGEPALFDIFDYDLIKGDPKTALTEPFSIVLSESMAAKYFSDEDPLGKILRLNNTNNCKVTGIIEDHPPNTHIQYDFFVSLSSNKSIIGEDCLDAWGRMWTFTYVVLEEHISLTDFNQKVHGYLRKYIREDYPSHVYLKPLTRIHFYSNILGEIGPSGDMNRIIIFSAIGVFILLIAGVNFMNLSTARSTQRAKEIGLRKVVGASRRNLIIQFLCESLFFSFLATLLSILIASLLVEEFNAIISRDLSIAFIWNPIFLSGLFLMTLIVGIMAGIYPAFLLSLFQPANIFTDRFLSGSKSGFVRKSLVVFQFTISIILIIGVIIIHQQMHYMKNKNLGIDKENIVVTEFRNMDIRTVIKYESLKYELLKNPYISNVSTSRFIPSFNGASTILTQWEGANEDSDLYVFLNSIDIDFVDTYGIELMEGRNFHPGDFQENAYSRIINESAVQGFGWENAIGKRLGEDYIVVGVIKDFHFSSLRDAIAPMILSPLSEPRPGTRARNQLSIKISPENKDETCEFIEKKYQEFFPNDIFEYRFFEEDFDWMYRAENRMAKTIRIFSIAAIFIACLGLFGLASYTAERRTKEIGVRKVLGASVPNIVMHLSREFTKWVLIANIIAWPVAYYAMSKWLQGFAYRTTIGPWIFALSALLALMIALLTVSYQSIKAALMNPVKSLKYE